MAFLAEDFLADFLADFFAFFAVASTISCVLDERHSDSVLA